LAVQRAGPISSHSSRSWAPISVRKKECARPRPKMWLKIWCPNEQTLPATVATRCTVTRTRSRFFLFNHICAALSVNRHLATSRKRHKENVGTDAYHEGTNRRPFRSVLACLLPGAGEVYLLLVDLT
jgi:hypothetical protein